MTAHTHRAYTHARTQTHDPAAAAAACQQNTQETEEALQDHEERATFDRRALDRETDFLESQIAALEAEICKEHERAEVFQKHCSFFSVADAEEQESEMALLNSKVEEVYLESIGENEANIGTLQLLTNIENKLEELFEKIARLPPDQVAEAEKAKDKQRRQRLREQKLAAQKAHQEARVRKALERAAAAPVKQTGKKLVFRSAPPKKKQTPKERKAQASAEEEEQQYFFGQ
eukprot:m.155185 g.155185  ORF g.155185 m.155185 type:complete len:232 (-) comp10202_c0_seq5:113-808(-)